MARPSFCSGSQLLISEDHLLVVRRGADGAADGGGPGPFNHSGGFAEHIEDPLLCFTQTREMNSSCGKDHLVELRMCVQDGVLTGAN